MFARHALGLPARAIWRQVVEINGHLKRQNPAYRFTSLHLRAYPPPTPSLIAPKPRTLKKAASYIPYKTALS